MLDHVDVHATHKHTDINRHCFTHQCSAVNNNTHTLPPSLTHSFTHLASLSSALMRLKAVFTAGYSMAMSSTWSPYLPRLCLRLYSTKRTKGEKRGKLRICIFRALPLAASWAIDILRLSSKQEWTILWMSEWVSEWVGAAFAPHSSRCNQQTAGQNQVKI